MASSVNKVILIGNLGRDPEIRAFQDGRRVCNMRIATSESWRDKATGERKDRTEWHSIVIYNDNLVGVAEKFLKKGSKVYIEGQLETRKYEKDGREVYTTEVTLRPYRGELTLLDSQSSRPPGPTEEDMDRGPSASASARPAGQAPSQDMDDEIPF
jgi:single-strand DNA-binding protein